MKRFIAVFIAALVVSAGWVFVQQTAAQTGPEIIESNRYLSINTVQLTWRTDVTSRGKVEYGTASGQYTSEANSTSGSTTSHQVYLRDLSFETTFYYRIIATDLDGNVTRSTEESFTTTASDLRIESISTTTIGLDKAVIETRTNKHSIHSVKYGTTADALTETGYRLSLEAGLGGSTQYYVLMDDLQPQTTYYYRVYVNRYESYHDVSEEAVSDVKSLTTTAAPSISGISRESGPPGSRLTITGQNFGSEPSTTGLERVVTTGCTPDYSYGSLTGSCQAHNVLSWSDTEIVVQINDTKTSGAVYVDKTVTGWGGTYANMFTIRGPEFRIVGAPVQDTSAKKEAFGCSLSTSTSNEATLKLSTIPVEGDNTYAYLQNVYNAYQEAWGRYPRCDELQFHMDHGTPLERLKEWLAGESITEKFGCTISTEQAGDSTIRVSEALRAGTDADTYLTSVYDAYYDSWGRYPRCDELQFHLDHNTPLTRLTTWLQENAPSDDTPAGDTTKTLTFSETGGTIAASPRTYSDTDVITFTGTTTPNSVVSLVIASEDPILTTVLSDSDGTWSYTLPGPLAAGDHTVQVTVSDNEGTILAESDEIAFTVTGTAAAATNTNTSTSEDDSSSMLLWLVVIIVAFIVVFIVFVMMKSAKSALKK